MDPDLSTKEATVDDYPKDSEDAEMTKEPFVNVPALDVSDPAFNASYRAYLQVYKTLTSSLVTKMCLSDRYTKIDDAQKVFILDSAKSFLAAAITNLNASGENCKQGPTCGRRT